MMRMTFLGAAFFGLAIGFGGGVTVTPSVDDTSASVEFGVLGAAAAPRHHGQGRRVARRTTRRVVRRTTLPAGCAWRAPYHYCGGVYYQPIKESGSTVYVVVNP